MRRILLLAVVSSGCSFPDPTIVEPPADVGESGVDTSVTGDAQQETGGDSTLAETSDVATDGAEAGDTTVVDGADTRPPSLCETGNMCDCDGDGDNKPGAGCDGNDCDDGDSRRNSKVMSYQSHDATGVAHGGDWNCNMNVEREFGDGSFTCSGLTIGGSGCTGAVGYKEATPVCGKTATKVTCKVNFGTVCATNTETPVTVLCK